MSDSTFLQFECDSCGEEHDVEVVHDSEPNDTWPLGWMLLRTRGIGLSADIEKVYCCKCRTPLLTAMGFTSYKEYVAIVKATAEMEQQHAQKQFVAQRGMTRIVTPSVDPKNLN
jgi:hypothetical protein